MRQDILLRSVQRLLGDDEQVHAVVMLTTRHRWFLPYSMAASVALYIIVPMTGIENLLNRLVLVVCGAAVAGMATTNYSVLAKTSNDLVLCRSSRIRQYAKELLRRLPSDTPMSMVGSTVITSDWKIDGVIYSMTKRWEPMMRQLSLAAAEMDETDRGG